MKPNLAISKPPVQEEVESHPLRSPINWGIKASYIVFGLFTICAVISVIYQVYAAKHQRTAIALITSELEQLRTDVVTTSNENSIYLKIMLLRPGIDKMLARDIAHSVAIRAREHHRDPDLVLAIIAVESHFDPNVVSYAGAIGLMQIMPIWKKELVIDRDLRDIDTSIKYGLDILAYYEKTFGGLEMALTAYNKGPNLMIADIKAGRVLFNGYSENVMRTYARIKSWFRP
jgi:hypothetical protein